MPVHVQMMARIILLSTDSTISDGNAGNQGMHDLYVKIKGDEPRRVVVFHPARRVTTLDTAEVLAAVDPRMRRLLAGRGLEPCEAEGAGRCVGEMPVLAGLAAGCVQGTVALGHDGARVHSPADRNDRLPLCGKE